MSRSFAELLAQLPDLLGGHLVLSVGALVVGIVVSIPLGAIATRRAGLRGPLLTVAGLIQTVPALALLALMVPLLGGRIGFLPAFLALTLYSVLPMLRNTVTGILDVDRAVTEAARGVGMTDRQSLLRVELPLAAPVIIAGIRTATVWVVGMATLATPVGAPSLGQYIFLGLQTRNWGAVLFGCAAAALLAIVLDQLIRALEHAARTRNRSLRVGALGALAAIVIAGVAPFALERVGSSSALPGAGDESGERAPPFDGRTLTVGTKGFTEQYILGDLLRRQLEDHGAVVESKPNLGSTVLFDALREDTVDVCVDYTGTIWTTVMKRAEPVARVPMQIDMAAYLKDEHGVITLGALGFENAYCLAMRRDRARELGVRTIADLARHGDLTVG
ncbi:MAG: ABC transporter permease/substrate-binding protein, partial [Planctomycetota bacterium]|nr:ABC transporter permease/substrate-binding protein [Planctomycetota bacterium]